MLKILTWGIATVNYYQVKFGTGVHSEDQVYTTSFSPFLSPFYIFFFLPSERMGATEGLTIGQPQDKSLGLLGLEGTLKSWYTYQIVYLITLCVVKFSILTFYRGISSQRSFRITIYTLMGIIGAFTTAMVFVNAFECPNPSDAWSTEILFQGKGSCRDLHPIYYSQAGFNILSDIVILLLPMPVLYNLQMRRNKRIALIAIFSIGSIAVIASAVRVYALTIWSAPHADVPYAGANILIWSQIEINTAIISASIPSLKPLFKQVFELTTAGSRTRQSLYYGRSFGNTNANAQKRLASHTEIGLGSAASLSFTPVRGRMSPNMELKEFGTASGSSGTETGRDKYKYSRNSDEEVILSNVEKYPDPQDYNPHEYFTALPPPTSASGNQNVTGDDNGESSTPGLHIMRSVTIETSVRNNEDSSGRGYTSRNIASSAADPFHYSHSAAEETRAPRRI